MTGSRKSTSGIIGSAARDSRSRNAPSITADSASSDSTRVEVQPYCVAHVSASSSGTTRGDQRREAGPVELRVDAARLHVRKLEVDRGDRDGADRQVDPEAGAPRPLVGQPAAERRAEDRRDAPDRGEQPLIAAALRRRKDVADDREQQAHDHAGANALQAAKQNQLAHAVERQERQLARRAAQRRRRPRTASRRAERTACGRGCRTGWRRSAPTRWTSAGKRSRPTDSDRSRRATR